MHRSRQQGFTLVEMISVLVIVAIILSIAIPAVTNLVKASALSSAAREVSNTLSLARQYAITHRTYTRVVFLYDYYNNSSTGTRADMWYHTYAVMTNRDTTNPSGWLYVTKWEYLPTGAVFLDLTGTGGVPGGGSLNDVNSPTHVSPTPSLRIEYLPLPFPAPNNNATLAYIEFGPTGAATASQAGTLTIQEGFITAANHPQPTPSTPVNTRTFVVDNLVGRVQLLNPP